MTGILADYVTCECVRCGAVLMVPARLATEAGGPLCHGCLSDRTDAEARATAERVRRGQDKTDKGGDGRRRCCDQATHDALRESDAWNRLEFVGYQDDGQGEKLELRNCPCGATLAILARESPSGADGAGAARVVG